MKRFDDDIRKALTSHRLLVVSRAQQSARYTLFIIHCEGREGRGQNLPLTTYKSILRVIHSNARRSQSVKPRINNPGQVMIELDSSSTARRPPRRRLIQSQLDWREITTVLSHHSELVKRSLGISTAVPGARGYFPRRTQFS